jgi:hypothetical protein
MFNFFRQRTAQGLVNEVRDNYLLPEVKEIPAMPTVNTPIEENKEYYRIGRTENGMTTLTMIGDGGVSMTLTMNQSACKQMIRMLQSTFDEEQPIEEPQE